ncbi:LysR family transcriptional regulator [Anabaena minutissima FACHB-250]|nr:LysR family transcriptional regulator [Anabaena minutissima FACHB-250]
MPFDFKSTFFIALTKAKTIVEPGIVFSEALKFSGGVGVEVTFRSDIETFIKSRCNSCPVAFGQLQVVPRLKAFLERYPDIKIDLMMADHFVDLIEEGVDLAIRIGKVQDTSLITQRIGTTRRITIGHQSYFERAGEPQTPEDLVKHNCIVYTRLATGNEWHFQGTSGVIQVAVSGNFQANNSTAIRAAVCAGLGIAVSPVWLFGDALGDGNLKVILKDYQPVPLPIYAVYRRGQFVPAKVLCLIDFLSNEFKLDPWVSDYGQSQVINGSRLRNNSLLL